MTTYEITQAERGKEQPKESNWWTRVKEFAGRHKGKAALGAAATSLALTFTTSTMGQIEHDAANSWPWFVAGGVTDTIMVAGLGMMAAGVRSDAWKHPLKLRSRLPELANQANESAAFRNGFKVNYAGALATSAVMIAGIVDVLPPTAWGTLAFPLLDAAATVTLRTALSAGIRNHLEQPQLPGTTMPLELEAAPQQPMLPPAPQDAL